MDEDYDWIDVLIDTDPIKLGEELRKIRNAALKVVEGCSRKWEDKNYQVDRVLIQELANVLRR